MPHADVRREHRVRQKTCEEVSLACWALYRFTHVGNGVRTLTTVDAFPGMVEDEVERESESSGSANKGLVGVYCAVLPRVAMAQLSNHSSAQSLTPMTQAICK